MSRRVPLTLLSPCVLVAGLFASACEPEASKVETDCALLCDRTVLCVEKHVAPEIASERNGEAPPDAFSCAFDDEDGARSTCEQGCVEEGESSPTNASCIACLADRLSCSVTAPMRPCDVDCEPTMFATGEDGEGALTYDYASWFFEGIDELEGLTCTQDDA